MNFSDWPGIKGLKKLFATQPPEPTHKAERIVSTQLNIVLPARAGVIAVVLYYLFYRSGFYEMPNTRYVIQETLKGYFVAYVLCNLVAGGALIFWRRFPPGIFQWLAFTLGLLDGLFMAGLIVLTGGFESIAYWVFPGLIVLNAISIPLAMPQIVINLMLCIFYLSAGILNAEVGDKLVLWRVPGRSPLRAPEQTPLASSHAATNTATGAGQPSRRRIPIRWDDSAEYFREEKTQTEPSMRVFVLFLLTACCYGVQVLAERQRRTFEEEREFAVREAQLRSAGRLAAEFTHQIKNPLAIINTAAFSIQRALKEGRTNVARQIEIIQEEVERSDKIVTQIMGYAQLSGGHVERINVAEDLDRAIEQVFPTAVDSEIQVERHYMPNLPPLLMQRRHFSDIVVNLLQNAREALPQRGRVRIAALHRSDSSIEISVEDNGPGIPPDKLERVFEAYYSTKEKGTGLGLAIVKHNVELYAGTVRIESGLGKGARFTLSFPAKTVVTTAT